MRSKRFLPKILLIAGFLSTFLIIKYKSEIKGFLSFNLEKFRIYSDNFFGYATSGPKRSRPISLLQKETELKLYVGEPFRSFSRRDWSDFWNLIYGVFHREAPEKAGLPRRVRRLTKEEIAEELTRRYPSPFSYFKEEHWGIFFGLILKNEASR